jgi:predicted DNA-binding transcriptional regulator AlpA
MKDSTKQMIRVAMDADPQMSTELKEAIQAIMETGRLSGLRVDAPLYLNLSKMAQYIGISRTTFYQVKAEAGSHGSSAFTPIEMTSGNWMYSKAHVVAHLEGKRCPNQCAETQDTNKVEFVATAA